MTTFRESLMASNDFIRYGDRGCPLVVPTPLARALQWERAAREDEEDRLRADQVAPLKPAPPPGTAIPVAPRRTRRRMGLPIFDAQLVAREIKDAAKGRRDEPVRLLQVLHDAARDDGLRPVIRPSRSTLQRLSRDLRQGFPNFGAAIDALLPELALQGRRRPEAFRVAPLLLHGTPGIGKTTFAAALAGDLKVDCEIISAGGTQGAFEIAGTSRHWSTTSPGRVATLLARGRTACSVLVIDEVDKLSGDQQHPTVPALLDLLEERSARRFRDASLEFTCDASRLLILATANDIERVPAPLRSRLREVAIALPTPLERREIAAGMSARLLQGLRPADRPVLDAEVLERLATAPIDLREVQRRLAQAVGAAVLAGRRRVGVADLPVTTEEARPRMGFVE